MTLKCSKCGLGVIVLNGKTITACKCNAPVVADIAAVATGSGNLNQGKAK